MLKGALEAVAFIFASLFSSYLFFPKSMSSPQRGARSEQPCASCPEGHAGRSQDDTGRGSRRMPELRSRRFEALKRQACCERVRSNDAKLLRAGLWYVLGLETWTFAFYGFLVASRWG